MAKALRWGKHLEAGIGESIRSKLELLLVDGPDRVQEPKKFEARNLAKSLREERPNVLLQAAYARLLILYFLNCLYEMVGILPMSSKYQGDLNSFVEKNSHFFPKEVIENAFSDDVALNELEQIYQHFERCTRANSTTVPPFPSSAIGWVEKISRFGRFLMVLRKRGASEPNDKAAISDPRIAKIFFSSVHLVPTSLHTLSRLKDRARAGRHSMVLLSVKEGTDADFKEIILGRMWLADSVLALLPRGPERFDGSVGGYSWIGKESALALMTDRQVSFAIEKGADTKAIEAGFSSIDDGIFEWADASEAAKLLRHQFGSKVHGVFELTDPDRPLDDRLEKQLDDLVRGTLIARTDKLMEGFLNQLAPEVLSQMDFLQSASSGVQKTWMASLLKMRDAERNKNRENGTEQKKKAEDRFLDLYRKAVTRGIILDGRKYFIMASDGNARGKHNYKNYYWRLPVILKKLRPWLDPKELSAWEDELVAWAVKRGREEIKKLQGAAA